jgi:hypothetical protein
MIGSLSTVAVLTGTTAVVVALVTLGLARAARAAGLPKSLAPSALLSPIGMSLHVVSIRQALARSASCTAFPGVTEQSNTITHFSQSASLTIGEYHESNGNRRTEAPFAGATPALSAGGSSRDAATLTLHSRCWRL